MQTNQTPTEGNHSDNQKAESVLDDAICSSDIPFDSPTPHAAIETVIDWLGIGYESTITRKSDGKKITIRITDEIHLDRQVSVKSAIQEVRKLDCGLWLSDSPEGKQKRTEMMNALDRLYKAAELNSKTNAKGEARADSATSPHDQTL
jgi:hypothetical protein